MGQNTKSPQRCLGEKASEWDSNSAPFEILRRDSLFVTATQMLTVPITPPLSNSLVCMSARRPPHLKPDKGRRRTGSASTSTTGFGRGWNDELKWRCAEGCGACCKLEKDPTFASPEEIFEDPKDVELYRSMVGSDGWCVHFDKTTRKCTIYADRPYFCRVEVDVFKSLYGIEKKRFDKEACSCCRDTIKAVYGCPSKELENFERSIRNPGCLCEGDDAGSLSEFRMQGS